MGTDRAFGADDIEALFPDEAPLTVVPWPRVVRPLRTAADREALQALLSTPPRADQFVDLDPRDLHASQPWITRAGVAYFLHQDAYRRSGCTFADQFSAANKYPIVHRRGDDLVVLSGHHRSAAALLQGVPLRARLVQAAWSAVSEAATAITPSVFAGGEAPSFEHQTAQAASWLEVFVNGGATAWLPAYDEVALRGAFRELAIGGEAWIDHQLHFARTGRIRPAADWPDAFATFYGCRTGA